MRIKDRRREGTHRIIMNKTILILICIILCACADQQKVVQHRSKVPAVVQHKRTTYASPDLRGLSDSQLDAMMLQALDSGEAQLRANRARRDAEDNTAAVIQSINQQGEAIQKAIEDLPDQIRYGY
jgi:hypothetical protein